MSLLSAQTPVAPPHPTAAPIEVLFISDLFPSSKVDGFLSLSFVIHELGAPVLLIEFSGFVAVDPICPEES